MLVKGSENLKFKKSWGGHKTNGLKIIKLFPWLFDTHANKLRGEIFGNLPWKL